jgi:hypothetical protein
LTNKCGNNLRHENEPEGSCQRFVDSKSWKANELKFFNNKLDGLKSMKVKLEVSHTTIISNCNLLTAGKFPTKVMQRKNARENARACDVTKIITSGRIKYEWRMVLKKSLK